MEKRKRNSFSCEVFPPKRNEDVYEIYKTLDSLKELKPDYISVTYGAGGSNSKMTSKICAYIQNVCDVEAIAHMTAVGMNEEILKDFLSELKKKSVKNILALRGDKPKSMTDEEFESRHYRYASDIIREIRKDKDMFILGACYPENHPQSKNEKEDIEHLKYKVDCGVDLLVTQMFFDNQIFYRFLDKIKAASINVPVHAGIMPITSAKQLGTTVQLSGSSVPTALSNIIAKYGDVPADMKKAGIEYAVKQIEDLRNNGVDGVHVYTMNKADITKEIYGMTFGA